MTLERRDLLLGVPEGSLRMVVSNPPYVSESELQTLPPDVREFEPLEALSGGPGGLDVYARLVPQAAGALGPGGALLLEVGHDQAKEVEKMARDAGFCARPTPARSLRQGTDCGRDPPGCLSSSAWEV